MKGDFKELMIADDLTRPQPQQLYKVAGLLVFYASEGDPVYFQPHIEVSAILS